MKRLIILNGPPNCGKDTIGGEFNNYRQEPASMKASLIDMALTMSGVGRLLWEERYNSMHCIRSSESYLCDTVYRMKDEPWSLLGGLSQRQYLIWLSEEVVKPLHGKEHFGWLLKSELDALSYDDDHDFILTDGGFKEEFIPFLGEDDWEVILIRLHRDGCTFENDSRNYLYHLCEKEFDVYNNGAIVDAVTEIKELIKEEK